MAAFRVGKPRLGLRRTTNFVSPGGNVTIEWQTAAYEDPDWWDVSTPTEVTIPKTGLWLIVLVLNRQAVAVADFVNAKLNVNGTTQLAARQVAGTDPLGLSLPMLRELAAGDVISALVESNNACTLPFTRLALDLTRIGPDRWT